MCSETLIKWTPLRGISVYDSDFEVPTNSFLMNLLSFFRLFFFFQEEVILMVSDTWRGSSTVFRFTIFCCKRKFELSQRLCLQVIWLFLKWLCSWIFLMKNFFFFLHDSSPSCDLRGWPGIKYWITIWPCRTCVCVRQFVSVSVWMPAHLLGGGGVFSLAFEFLYRVFSLLQHAF